MTVHFVHLLDALLRKSLRMASLVEDMLEEAGEALLSLDESLARRVISRDREVDAEEVEVESEVIRLMALYQPVGSDLRLLCTVLKVNNDLERIADCAVNIAERASYLDEAAASSSSDEVRQMIPLVRRMLRRSLQAYGAQNADQARSVFPEDEVVDALYAQAIQRVVADASTAPDHLASLVNALSVAKNLERIADHATNIAEDVIFLATGRIVRHGADESDHHKAK